MNEVMEKYSVGKKVLICIFGVMFFCSIAWGIVYWLMCVVHFLMQTRWSDAFLAFLMGPLIAMTFSFFIGGSGDIH